MRWKPITDGTTRVKSGFLIFPKTIENETRWLEYARWEQRYFNCSGTRFWSTKRWIDD